MTLTYTESGNLMTDPAVQEQGSSIDDRSSQAAVEGVINNLIWTENPTTILSMKR